MNSIKSVILSLLLLTGTAWAQAPQSIKYQSIIRDANGDAIATQPVSYWAKIRRDTTTGPIVFQEAGTVTTNDFGLVTRNIGETNIAGFSAIDWENGPFYMEIEIDPNGGNSYTINSISQLLSVPYSIYANVADTVLSEADPLYSGSVAAGISATDTAIWNSKLSSEVDGSITNEIQQLSISNDSIFLSNNGGVVKLPGNNASSHPPVTRFRLDSTASCPLDSFYLADSVYLETGIYFFTLYSCAGQIGQQGFGISIQQHFWPPATGDATSTFHDFNSGGCGHYFTGLIRVTTAGWVAVKYETFGGSSFDVQVPLNVEIVEYWKIF